MENPSEINRRASLNVIRSRENPNPVVVVLIIIIIMIVTNLFFKLTMKVNLSGSWVSLNNTSHMIVHNTVNDIILVDNILSGVISGDVVYIYNGNKVMRGIITNNTIGWLNGDIWKKEVAL